MPREDMLSQMFKEQSSLMDVLGVDRSESVPFSEAVKEAVLGVISEGGECADVLLISTKPWKQVPVTTQRRQLVEELIDVWFFIMEAFILLGLSPSDLYFGYKRKVKQLYARIKRREEEEERNASRNV